MAFDIRSTLESIQSYIQSNAEIDGGCVIGEPKNQPDVGSISCAVFMDRTHVVRTTLTKTIELHQVTVRFYVNMLSVGDETETIMARAVESVASDLLGDFDLGATIRAIDAAGSDGTPLRCRWGYADVSGQMYRIVDMTVPLIVDDSITTTA